MKISIAWLNTYLDRPVDADEADRVLTDQGLPIESCEPVPGSDGDLMLDVEVTSNRSDCLSHLGLAREIAAGTGRVLVEPDPGDVPTDNNSSVEQWADVEVEDQTLCPMYTARMVRGVTVGPSPAWLVGRLESIGVRSVNNVVDVTNFVLMESGQPLHAFDLATLKDQRVVVRRAKPNEAFEAIDGSKHQLREDMLVIADGQRAVALAGVMGGISTEVTGKTTDILIESARFDPLSVRRTSRALKLASESSYRFEREIDPGQVDAAGRRAAAMICELAGGVCAGGVITVGRLAAERPVARLRSRRCNTLLGLEIPLEKMTDYLARLGFDPEPDPADPEVLVCKSPSYRHDVTREIDLIEEVARLHGYEPIGVDRKIHIATQPVQPDVAARREIRRVLTAHGFNESINPSLILEKQGRAFLPRGAEKVMIDDQHRRPDAMLRPSLVPSLLGCRKLNQDVGNNNLGLFEMASAWSLRDDRIDGQETVALLIDAADPQRGLRTLRAAIADLIKQLAGTTDHQVTSTEVPGYTSAATICGHGKTFGLLGIVSPKASKGFDLQTPVAAAEISVAVLTEGYPPARAIRQLPRYPSIQRDLSLIVADGVTWDSILKLIDDCNPEHLEHTSFIGTYRGKPIPKGKKSVSLRLEFRNPNETLRHDQVDPQMTGLVKRFGEQLAAELRT